MAIVFELWAECQDAEALRRFAGHFSGLTTALLTGRNITWSAEKVGDCGDDLAVVVWSPELSRSGVRTLRDALETTEAGLKLLHHLLAAPDFRYARVGWEAANIPVSDLSDYLERTSTGPKQLSIHCVVDDALWVALGQPEPMPPFRPGYRWKPYEGETYEPLFSNDQPKLWQLRQELLPP